MMFLIFVHPTHSRVDPGYGPTLEVYMYNFSHETCTSLGACIHIYIL